MKSFLFYFCSYCPFLFWPEMLVFPNADVYYPGDYEDLAVYIGNTFESIRQKAIDLIGNDPGRINIVPLTKAPIRTALRFLSTTRRSIYISGHRMPHCQTG